MRSIPTVVSARASRNPRRGALWHLSVALLASALLGCSGAPKPAPQPPAPEKLTVKDIVNRSTAGIVRVEAGSDKVGTGFIVDSKGLVVTNLHVVAGESKIAITLANGTKLPVTEVAAAAPEYDLVLLKVAPTSTLVALKLGDSSVAAAGDAVIAIGNPLGVLDYSVSNGLISSVRKLDDGLTLLQISAPISQGSSGGPLFNQDGEVIGVTTAIITAGQNLNIAMPSNYIVPLLTSKQSMSLDEFADKSQPAPDPEGPSQGRIKRSIPRHKVAEFDTCELAEMVVMVESIGQAIETGAPLYNQGNHQGCFLVYEATSIKLEKNSKCKAIRNAFGDGLLRANSANSFTDKAWAIRDAFDGLLDVAARWSQSRPAQPAKPNGKPQPK